MYVLTYLCTYLVFDFIRKNSNTNYSQSSELLRHVASVHKRKIEDYGCDFCDSIYFSEDDLSLHISFCHIAVSHKLEHIVRGEDEFDQEKMDAAKIRKLKLLTSLKIIRKAELVSNTEYQLDMSEQDLLDMIGNVVDDSAYKQALEEEDNVYMYHGVLEEVHIVCKACGKMFKNR